MLGHLVQRRAQAPGVRRLQPVEHVEHDVHVLGRRRHVLDDVAVERHQADAIALPVDQVGQATGEHLAVLELGHATAAEPHRFRDVQQHREVGVRVGLVLLDVIAIGAGVQTPVHAADVVARHVAAVLGEIDRRAEVRRAVNAVDEPVDHGARHQLEIANAREDGRINEPGAGNG